MRYVINVLISKKITIKYLINCSVRCGLLPKRFSYKMAQWDAKDKTFVVTGGASGLGAAYVELFVSHGAKSVAVLDVAEAAGQALVDRLVKTYGNNKAVFIKCDVSKEDEITSAFDAVVAQFKQIDVIINNAGIMVDTPQMWRTACDVNWQGLVSFTLKGIKHMRKDEGGAGGTIVNISSAAALVQAPYLPMYNGSKAAVLHFSQCLSMDPFYKNTSIRILTMCYGATDTPLLHNLDKRAYDPKIGQILTSDVNPGTWTFQKVESAVAAFNEMMKTGANGTVWLSIDNKPAKDITDMINGAFKHFEEAISL